jgi:hypothetical protein
MPIIQRPRHEVIHVADRSGERTVRSLSAETLSDRLVKGFPVLARAEMARDGVRAVFARRCFESIAMTM